MYSKPPQIEIEEPLLAHIIGGRPHGLPGIPELGSLDNVVGGRSGYRHYLIYLVSKMFNLHKHVDGMGRTFDTNEDFYCSLSEEHYEDSLNHLRELYQYSQNYIHSDYFQNKYDENINNGKWKVYRGIRDTSGWYSIEYAYDIYKLVRDAESQGCDKAYIQTDIFTFFAGDHSYAGILDFESEIPFEDILLYDEAVSFYTRGATSHEYEMIVINRDPKNLMGINTASLRCCPELENKFMTRYLNGDGFSEPNRIKGQNGRVCMPCDEIVTEPIIDIHPWALALDNFLKKLSL